MNKTYLTAAVLLVLTASGVTLGVARGDRDDDEDSPPLKTATLAPGSALYRSECGACHLAYPPGLLPAEAWRRVMGSLGHHYGDDASLEPAPVREIAAYLEAHAADRNPSLRSRAFAVPLPADRPPRITETRYFRRLHSEVPVGSIENNPEVPSFSTCQACHQGAERWNFDDDKVKIPPAGG